LVLVGWKDAGFEAPNAEFAKRWLDLIVKKMGSFGVGTWGGAEFWGPGGAHPGGQKRREIRSEAGLTTVEVFRGETV